MNALDLAGLRAAVDPAWCLLRPAPSEDEGGDEVLLALVNGTMGLRGSLPLRLRSDR